MEEAKAKLTEINLSDDPAVTLTIRLIMQGKNHPTSWSCQPGEEFRVCRWNPPNIAGLVGNNTHSKDSIDAASFAQVV